MGRKFDDFFPSKYLRASDITEDGIVLVMERVEREEMANDGKKKPVLYFKNEERGLVLNKTNGRRIVDMYGDDVDTWAGKLIKLFQSETDVKGEPTKCIRIKSSVPKMEEVGSLPNPDDLPF